MKKLLLSGILMLTLMLGASVVSAQVGDIDPLGNSAGKCLNLTADLRVTSTGSQVSDLQFFLQSKGYLNSEPTGYFGLLTQAAVIKYQIASGISGTGFVGPLTRANINAKSCNSIVEKPVVTPAPVVTPVDKKAPSITLEAKSGSERSTSTITLEKGEKFKINGTPKNLKGLKYGDNGFTASWNFGSILDNSCSNTKIKATNKWKFSCKANKTGSTDVHVEIYKDGKTYSSNTIRVNVIGNEEEEKPEIDMVRGKAGDDFEVFPGEPISIAGKNLIHEGKDAKVFIDGESAIVTQYDENVLYFTAPNLKSGEYNLQVRTSAGRSNTVEVYVAESRIQPNITMVRGKAMDDFEVNANESTSIEGSNLVFADKDARVFIGSKEGTVTQYNERVLYFDVPNMESGTYTLYVETSAGKSNTVTVKVNGKG